MLPFDVRFRSGVPAYEQVVYAVKKALVSGQLRPGDVFPSVRTLSQELRINPNTAHKIVSTLANQGLLEVRPGIGTVVGQAQPATAKERAQLLEDDVERLIVEAKKLGLSKKDVVDAVQDHWSRLGSD